MEPVIELAESGLRYRLRRALRQIGEQHRQLDEIQRRLGAAVASGDRGDARDAFVRFRHAVGAHFELEDGVFFPALHGLHPEEGADLEALSREHEGMLGELRRLAPLLESAPLDRFGASFGAFREEFSTHERREERLVSRLADRQDTQEAEETY
jgi:hypothetical protein